MLIFKLYQGHPDEGELSGSPSVPIGQRTGLVVRKGSLYWYAFQFKQADESLRPTLLSATLETGGDLSLDAQYWWIVTAVIANKTETLPSHVLGAVPYDPGTGENTGTDPDTGTGSDLDAYQKVLLTWSPVTGATSYRIYRIVERAGPPKFFDFKFLAEVMDTMYTDSSSDYPAVDPPYTLHNHPLPPFTTPQIAGSEGGSPVLGFDPVQLLTNHDDPELSGWLCQDTNFSTGLPATFPGNAVFAGGTMPGLLYTYGGAE